MARSSSPRAITFLCLPAGARRPFRRGDRATRRPAALYGNRAASAGREPRLEPPSDRVACHARRGRVIVDPPLPPRDRTDTGQRPAPCAWPRALAAKPVTGFRLPIRYSRRFRLGETDHGAGGARDDPDLRLIHANPMTPLVDPSDSTASRARRRLPESMSKCSTWLCEKTRRCASDVRCDPIARTGWPHVLQRR
jgi:hypothetical protein